MYAPAVIESGRKVTGIGRDLRVDLGNSKGRLEQAGESNDGFTAVAAFRDAVTRLDKETGGIADGITGTALAMVEAANAHERNEELVRSEMAITRDALGRVPA